MNPEFVTFTVVIRWYVQLRFVNPSVDSVLFYYRPDRQYVFAVFFEPWVVASRVHPSSIPDGIS